MLLWMGVLSRDVLFVVAIEQQNNRTTMTSPRALHHIPQNTSKTSIYARVRYSNSLMYLKKKRKNSRLANSNI
jgi:hypothetical protein